MLLVRINLVAHEGCTAFVLMLFDGGGDFLAVEIDSDLLTATAVILSTNCYVFYLTKVKMCIIL